MEGFLSRLVMDAEGSVSQRKTMKEIAVIRDNITSDDEERQRMGLIELCDMLNMSTSLTISSIRPNVFVPPLLNCLKREHNIDLMLLAARALTYMVDAIPTTVFVLGTEGGIDIVLQPLREVKDIELTEQCLLCIDKVTQTPPGALMTLEKGGVNALLSFVDFFSSSSQRKAWTSVAAMCRRVDLSTFDKVQSSLGEIRARVDNDDAKIAEKCITSLYRIIIGVRSKPELVAESFGDVCPSLMSVLTRTDLTENTFTTTLTLIGAAVSHSTEVTQRALESGLVECLFALISRSSEEQSSQTLRSPGASPMLRARSPFGVSFPNDSISRGVLPSTGAAAAAAAVIPRDKRLTMEQTRTICVALAGLLPRIMDSYLAHGNVLTELLSERSRSSKRQRFFRISAMGGEEGPGDAEIEEDEETMTLEDIRARILEDGPPIVKNPRYSTCRLTHVCDGCRKACIPGDWFRCNVCSDFDFCAQCLLLNWGEHGDSSTPHTFCDMQEVLPSTSNSNGSSATGASNPTGSTTATATSTSTTETKKSSTDYDALNDVRQELYKNNPHLLDIIVTGLPKMVTLFNESETHIVRNHTLAFIDRAVFLASPQQLQNSGMDEAAVCQMIVAAVTDSSLILNVQAMPLCRKLLEKLPNVYKSAFVREGVSNALSKVQQQNLPKTSTSESSEEKKPLIERLHTVADWRELVVSEAKSLVEMFPSVDDTTRVARLTEVVRLMQEGNLHKSFEKLRLAILDDTTAYELASSKVLHELRETLSRVNDIRVIVDLVKILAKDVKNAPCALTRFVRHLQTVMSQLDQFSPPNLGDVSSIHAQIPVRLLPHPVETSRQKTTPTSKGGVFRRLTANTSSSSNSNSNSNSRETSLRRPARVTSTRTGSITSTSANQSNNTSSATKESPEAHEVTVCIEPLTNMEALMSFVSLNILGGSADESGSRRRQEDEERVEEILPELGGNDSTGNTTKPKKATKEKQIRPVYLRYGNHVLPPSMTILQVIQKYHNTESSSASSNKRNTHSGGRGLSERFLAMREGFEHEGSWDIIKLYYSNVPFGPEYSNVSTQFPVPRGTPEDPLIVKKPSDGVQPPAVVEVMHALNREYLFSDRFLTVAQKDVLTLLGTFYEVLKNWSDLLLYVGTSEEKEISEDVWSPSTSLSDFIHRKLNNKAMRHCSNLLLAGQHLNLWAVNLALDCNFLFAPTTRKYLFEISFCGTIRSLVQMQENMEKNGTQTSSGSDYQVTRVYTLQREKKRVWRDKALACAMHIMGKGRISGSSILEFEYYNENGSGSGPTMEFYSLVSDELREMKLGLWRRTDETPNEKYYHPHNGVYPRPLPPKSPEIDRIEPYFLLLGRLIARALLDKRIISIPLSPVLLKMLRGDECGVYDLIDISDSLGASIVALSLAAQKGSTKVQMPGSSNMCSVEDLRLDFTLPGDEPIELKPGGESISVTSKNVLEYCDAVTLFILQTGVERVVKALRTGFHDYIPLYALRMLSVEELNEAIHGHASLVTVEELEANCLADHGYTITSRHVRLLFEIIASFNAEEQERFFLFLTGSAHLPVGGLASLRPKFTIVRKTSSDARVREQDQLPSAMTCQNYLKLPAYDSKEQMEQKLRQAIDEGCGAFLLT